MFCCSLFQTFDCLYEGLGDLWGLQDFVGSRPGRLGFSSKGFQGLSGRLDCFAYLNPKSSKP